MIAMTKNYIDFAIRNLIYLSLIILLLGWGKILHAVGSDIIFGVGVGVITGFVYCFISHLIVVKGAICIAFLNVFLKGWFPLMSPKGAIFIFVGVVYEEIVWRVYILSEMAMEYQLLGVWVTSLCFYLIHFNVFKLNAKLKVFELFVFSVIICFLWVYTRNLYAICLFHYIRNHISMNMILYHSAKKALNDAM